EDIYDFYQDGGTLASLKKLTQQDLNDLNSYDYTAYQSGYVITARNLFHLLTYLVLWNFDYSLSLGLCLQRLSNHED
ncbi:CesD/SycD/LcrH family type III secretion system chaperone, partial [Escherichia coli]